VRNASRRVFHILLVEDDHATVSLVRHVCSFPTPRRLHHVATGSEALAFLAQQGVHARARTPDLILLDLNLPGLSGLEVLRTLKADDRLKVIPCLVISTSAAQNEILAAYDAGAAAYIVKPAALDQLIHTLEVTLRMWLTIATLPVVDRQKLNTAGGAV
jgi:CheY-like chemotaxis protein